MFKCTVDTGATGQEVMANLWAKHKRVYSTTILSVEIGNQLSI